MTTRVFCDNCGNTVKVPNKFKFGPVEDEQYLNNLRYLSQQNAQQQLLGQQGSNHQFGVLGGGIPVVAMPSSLATTTRVQPPTQYVDLCDHCVPIWMTRVEKLTKGSDPEQDV